MFWTSTPRLGVRGPQLRAWRGLGGDPADARALGRQLDDEVRPSVRDLHRGCVSDARILEGVAIGSSTLQPAGKLHLSRHRIEYHVSGMLRRFKAPNRSALVFKACSIGLFGIGTWPPNVLPKFVRS